MYLARYVQYLTSDHESTRETRSTTLSPKSDQSVISPWNENTCKVKETGDENTQTMER